MELPILQPNHEPSEGGGAPVSASVLSALLDEIHHQTKGALLYTHHRADTNTEAIRKAAEHLYGIIDLLVEKGVITKEEVESRRKDFAPRIAKQFKEKGMGAIRLVPEMDKYTFKNNDKVDCEARLHVCRAACCRLPFALSRQDIKEGTIQWNLAHPYVIQHGADGFCVHRDTKSCHCTVYEKRPVACRAYDCSEDDRIWSDFDAMKLSPELESLYREMDAHESPEADG